MNPPPPCANACAYDAQGGFSCGPPARARLQPPRQPQGTAFVGREGYAPAEPAEPVGWLERVCCTRDAARCDAVPDTIKRVACKAACDPSC